MSCFLKCFLDGVCVIDAGIGLDLFVGSFSGVFFFCGLVGNVGGYVKDLILRCGF